jgi:hypothetical protein
MKTTKLSVATFASCSSAFLNEFYAMEYTTSEQYNTYPTITLSLNIYKGIEQRNRKCVTDCLCEKAASVSGIPNKNKF